MTDHTPEPEIEETIEASETEETERATPQGLHATPQAEHATPQAEHATPQAEHATPQGLNEQ